MLARFGAREATGGPASAIPSDAAPIDMNDLQRLEHLAWLVDTHTGDEEAYVEAKLALLHRPPPDPTVGPAPELTLPTDELSALDRLRGAGHLTDAEHETLRRRILLRI